MNDVNNESAESVAQAEAKLNHHNFEALQHDLADANAPRDKENSPLVQGPVDQYKATDQMASSKAQV